MSFPVKCYFPRINVLANQYLVSIFKQSSSAGFRNKFLKLTFIKNTSIVGILRERLDIRVMRLPNPEILDEKCCS